MPVKIFRIMPRSVCEKEILTVLAELGIEAEESTVKFQSLLATRGRVYSCDNSDKLFVKDDDVL
jgi:hypothetical protein